MKHDTRLEEPITITIGGPGDETLWRAVVTNAPKDYDGFGTFTVCPWTDGNRIVMIREQHYDWQAARYHSGMKLCESAEAAAAIDRAAILDTLWKLLRGGDYKPMNGRFATGEIVVHELKGLEGILEGIRLVIYCGDPEPGGKPMVCLVGQVARMEAEPEDLRHPTFEDGWLDITGSCIARDYFFGLEDEGRAIVNRRANGWFVRMRSDVSPDKKPTQEN